MASTRSKNTPGNYCMEQWSLEKQAAFPVYTNARVPVESMIAGDGLVHGRMGGTELAYNAVDIETQLFGIGSTNLANPKAAVNPQLKNLPSLSVIDRLPVILPEPLVIQENQRQYPMK